MRAQLAVREALVQTRSRYISLVGAVLRREGLRIATGSAEGFMERVEKLALRGQMKSEIAPLLAVLCSINHQLVWVDGGLEPFRHLTDHKRCGYAGFINETRPSA